MFLETTQACQFNSICIHCAKFATNARFEHCVGLLRRTHEKSCNAELVAYRIVGNFLRYKFLRSRLKFRFQKISQF